MKIRSYKEDGKKKRAALSGLLARLSSCSSSLLLFAIASRIIMTRATIETWPRVRVTWKLVFPSRSGCYVSSFSLWSRIRVTTPEQKGFGRRLGYLKKKFVTDELFFLNASTFTATVVLYFLCAIVKLHSFYDQPNWLTSSFIDFLISLHKYTIDVQFSRNKWPTSIILSFFCSFQFMKLNIMVFELLV